MKNFFHLTASIILGSLLGYGLYFKILNKRTSIKADDIAVDAVFYTNNSGLDNRQKESVTLKKSTYADTLQVSPEFFQATPPAKTVVQTDKSIASKPIKVIETVRTIEVAHLQKPKTIAIPVSKVAPTEKIDVAYVSTEKGTKEVPVVSTAAENDANTEVQEEKKKKFLFFNRRERNN